MLKSTIYLLIKPEILFPLILKVSHLNKALKINSLQERMAPECGKPQICLNFFDYSLDLQQGSRTWLLLICHKKKKHVRNVCSMFP